MSLSSFSRAVSVRRFSIALASFAKRTGDPRPSFPVWT
jgi:hypothetical protein